MKIFVLLAGFMIMTFCGAFADEGETGAKADPKKDEYTKRQADNPEIAIETTYGTMTFELYRDVAPAHVDSMLARIKEGFYDGRKIFRVIKGFMMQTGDPKDIGIGSAGYQLPAEFSDLPHERGTLSMARGQDINSASCQFFVVFNRAPHLDKKYTVFGQMMSGDSVLTKIENVKVKRNPMTNENAYPVEDVMMKKVTVLKDIESKSSGKSEE